MILMQFVAEGGEKVKVEALAGGRVRFLVEHGSAGFSSFLVPVGQVVGLGTALVSGEAVDRPAASHLVEIPLSLAKFKARAHFVASADTDGVLPGLQL